MLAMLIELFSASEISFAQTCQPTHFFYWNIYTNLIILCTKGESNFLDCLLFNYLNCELHEREQFTELLFFQAMFVFTNVLPKLRHFFSFKICRHRIF